MSRGFCIYRQTNNWSKKYEKKKVTQGQNIEVCRMKKRAIWKHQKDQRRSRETRKSCDQYWYKKKELLGEFTRGGTYLSTKRICGHDHDFATQSTGKLVPFGIYDIQANTGRMTLNLSHDTSELNCKAIENRWTQEGQQRYPHATEIVALNDCWWSNGYRSLLYKHELQLLANRMNMNIRIAHYPPCTSKYNPIEHKLFCHIHRACEWVMFTDVELVQQLMARAKTEQWLTVSVDIDHAVYQTGRKVPKKFEQSVRNIPHRDELLQQWNYVIKPNKNYQVIF